MAHPGPDPLPSVLDVALDISARLARLDLAFVIGGAIASSVHGEPRSTFDVDIVVDLHAADIDRLIRTLSPDFYIDRDAVVAAVLAATSVNAVHVRAGVKVDFFVAGADRFEAERLRHRMAVVIAPGDAATLWVDLPEHAVLRKLEWFQRGGEVSERQWRDVVGIIQTQGASLDRARLAAWAPRLGVEDLLARALLAAG